MRLDSTPLGRTMIDPLAIAWSEPGEGKFIYLVAAEA